jgi:hypothetical protein
MVWKIPFSSIEDNWKIEDVCYVDYAIWPDSTLIWARNHYFLENCGQTVLKNQKN